MAELEESRRKLVNLKMQKEAASVREQPVLGSINWSVSPEYTVRTMDVQELKDSIEETQVLADDRLIELQDAKDDNSVLLKQLQDLKVSNLSKDGWECKLWLGCKVVPWKRVGIHQRATSWHLGCARLICGNPRSIM
nr:E3 ubiquitin-protein ligase BRE1-like 2 isoform X2 [Ipomoea batatas]